MKNILLALAFISILFTPLYSANYEADEMVEITAASYGDYYLAGKEVRISTIIFGDVLAGAENIWIKDSVKGDVMLGGAMIDISSHIGDDARLSGGEVIVNGRIEGDLIIFGGQIRLTQEGSVGGDVIIYGGQVNIYGTVGGDLISAGGEIRLKSNVGGDAMIKGGSVSIDGQIMGDAIMSANELKLGDNAGIGGDVRYWNGDGELDFSNIAASATFDEELAIVEEEMDWSTIISLMGIGMISYWVIFILSTLFVIVILQYFAGKYLEQAAGHMTNSFVKSFGYGMLFFIGLPVLVFVLIISLIGIPLGLLGLSIYGIALLFSTTITGMLTAYYFKNKSNQEWSFWQTTGYSLLTVVVYKILFFIPIVGWLLKRIAAAAVYGAILLMSIERKKAA